MTHGSGMKVDRCRHTHRGGDEDKEEKKMQHGWEGPYLEYWVSYPTTTLNDLFLVTQGISNPRLRKVHGGGQASNPCRIRVGAMSCNSCNYLQIRVLRISMNCWTQIFP